MMIELQNVIKSYKSSNSRKVINVVDDISLSMEAGKSYGLVGHNGAGKTTLLKCIATLSKQTSGTILVNNKSTLANPLDVRRDVAFLSASINVDPFFSARYLFGLFGIMYGMDKQSINEKMDELFDHFNIGSFCDKRINELSTGMKQKVMIALTLLHDASVYILDEPTNGLDILTSQKVISYLRLLQRDGKTLIISSHIMSEIEKSCDELVMIVFGKVANFGTSESILKESGAGSLEDAYLSYYKKAVKEVEADEE